MPNADDFPSLSGNGNALRPIVNGVGTNGHAAPIKTAAQILKAAAPVKAPVAAKTAASSGSSDGEKVTPSTTDWEGGESSGSTAGTGQVSVFMDFKS